MKECLFCKIVKGEIPKDFVYQDQKVVAFKDIHPLAPVHILIVPKRHIEHIGEITKSDIPLIGRLVWVAKKIASDLDISDSGYKLLFRVKEHGGQEIPHIHLHLIGGAKLTEDIHPVQQEK